MSLAARFNSVACLAIGTAILCDCVAESTPGLALLGAPLLLLGWRVGRAPRPWVLPRILASLLVLGAILWAALQVVQSRAPLVSHLTQFLIVVQLIKLFDRRTPRDDGQLLSLSLFIVIGAILTANSLPVGALLLAYSPLATAAAMLLQVRRGEFRLAAARAAALGAEGPGVAEPRRDEHGAGRRLAGVAVLAVVLSSVLAVVGFLITPRGFAQGALGQLGAFSQPVIGFTDQVRLGQAGFLSEDGTPIMDVQLGGTDGQPVNDPGGSDALYLRGSVLDTYDPASHSWVFSARQTVDVRSDVQHDGLTYLRDVSGPEKLQVRVSMRVPLGRPGYVFTPWAPIRLRVPRTGVVMSPTSDLVLRFQSTEPGPGHRLEYTVWTSPEARAPMPVPAAGVRRGPAAGSFQSGPVRDLAAGLLEARHITLDAGARQPADNRAAAAAIQSHLRARCSYTRQLVAPDAGVDPIEMFLFRTKSGNCEYFASATVAMCQSVGLEARVVTGYLATEFNSVNGQYLVRQSDAHAWAEVALGDGRWLTVDASPPAEIDRLRGRTGGVLGRLRQMYEAIDFAWNSTVISFDERRRVDLLGSLSRRTPSPSRIVQSLGRLGERLFGDDLSRTIRASRPGLFWLAVGAGVALALVLLRRPLRRVLRARRRARWMAGAGGAGSDPALLHALSQADFYTRTLEHLESARLGKPVSRPPLSHARALLARDAVLSELLAQTSELFYQVRFARRPLSPEQARMARRLPDDVASRLRAMPPLNTAGR